METQRSVRRRALRWCRNLAGWFPAIRPGAEALAVAEDVAASLGPNDGTVSLAHVRHISGLVDDRERRRLVESFTAEHGDQWALVCADAGGVEALEGALVEGAARVAILERRLPPETRLADLEVGRAPDGTSLDVLTVTLPPEAVWSIVEANHAEQRVGVGPSPFWTLALEEVVAELGTDVHVERVRGLARALGRQLPEPRYPRATALLAQAYSRAADDCGLARQVARQLMGIYLVQRASYSTSRN